MLPRLSLFVPVQLELPKTEKDHQFNLKFDANTHESITIREISGLHLNKIETIAYSCTSKEADISTDFVKKMIRRMPDGQKEILLKKLIKDQDKQQ